MSKLLLILSFLFSTQVFAYSASLDPVLKLTDNCLATTGTTFCDAQITEGLKTVGLNARGEFVMYLKEIVKTNNTEKFITNLYQQLQVLVPMYEKLDTCEEWSCKDMKNFFGDVSVSYIKIAPVSSDFYIQVFKTQATGGGRYNILNVLSAKADTITKLSEMDEMVTFAEFAKNLCKSVKDEFWITNVGIDIIRKMTVAATHLRPGHEGVYSIQFDDKNVTDNLKIDRVVVMEANDRDSLIVNFVSSDSRVIKVAFTQAGLLGNTFFSNIDVYNNDNNQEIQSPVFKMELDRTTGSIKGFLGSARYGKSNFTGTLIKSNLSVFSETTVANLTLEQLVGSYNVTVGSYEMTLTIGKRTADKTIYEAALVNDNALITFSKVTLDSAKGILSIVDSKNERKLTLAVTGVTDGVTLKGQLLNAPQAKIFDVVSK